VRGAFVAIAALCLSLPRTAVAQERPEEVPAEGAPAEEEGVPRDAPPDEAPPEGAAASDEARALFEQGIAFSEEERWGEAVEYFRRSRQLVERPSTVFNMAVALLRLGRPTDALDALRDYLRIAGPEEEERRAEARRMLELALSSTAELRLFVAPAGAEVRVDGARTAGDGPERVITLDPGTHTLHVSASGHTAHTSEVSLLTGERATRSIDLEPVVQPADPIVPPPIETRSVFEEPWLWVVAAVIVVGAGVGIGIALGSGTADPYPGTTGVVLSGLRAR
jgi:hypothetical protein